MKKLTKQNKTYKIAALLFVITATLFLCACSTINTNRAENVMKAKLDDRFGAGNYTISDIHKHANGEYSLIYGIISAKVTLNSGEEFYCHVENRNGNYYQYSDGSAIVFFPEEWVVAELEKNVENINGVKVKDTSLSAYGLQEDFYDASQAAEFFDMLDKQGWNCVVFYEIDTSLSPEEATDAADQVMDITKNCIVPNIQEVFEYGETTVSWGTNAL